MPRLNSMRLIHLPKISALLLLAFITLTLSGCFLNDDDDDPAAVVDADPSGYYINTGSASVDDGVGGTIVINDLQAVVNGNRIMMMSVTNELLYDGIITSISIDSFTADFTIYRVGKDPITATASGTITQNSKIDGTLTGSGVGSGAFSLLYAMTNSQVAMMISSWRGDSALDYIAFAIYDAGSLVNASRKSNGSTLFAWCKMDGIITPVSGTRVYSASVDLTGCADSSVDGRYTGLTTTRDEGATDNRLVYMVSNGTYTLSGEFNPD